MTGAAAKVLPAPAWLTDFYVKVDACDTAAVLAGFAADGTMTYGAGAPMSGHEAIRAGLDWLFGCYTKIEHEFLNVWTSGAVLLLEANVTYGCPDGRDVTVPALTVIEHRDGVIDDLRIFIDPTPIQAG
ncbi:nuclear transport factor 2 family protein [Amycolatopsis lexingtonensis]|uniref:nuclear transport factor 2 family protein n=1 Tax=Amycolatopsis lexingtonensis TaxID=218822 RepID=UPI003F6E9A4F